MLVGEAPDRDEDVSGLPFAGMAGELLNRMLSSIGLSRQSVYFANAIPWRPPGNRAPTQAEMDICAPFIQQHIKLLHPDLLILMGGLPVKMILGKNDNALKLRGKWLTYEVENAESRLDTLVTLHPSYLIKQPAQKRHAWHDLLLIKEKLANG
jgi:DNA polymerase